MTTEVTENVQKTEKVGLKRKLTGPPRLLLGKTRTRSTGEDGPEARTERDGDNPSLKVSSAAGETGTAELTECANMEEVSHEVKVDNHGRRCEVTGEGDDVRDRKVVRHRWWRRFFSVVVCVRRRKKNKEKSSVEDAGASKERRRVHMRFRSSIDVQTHGLRKDSEPLLRTKLRRFFTKGGRSGSSEFVLENTEQDVTRAEELQSEGTHPSSEAMAITARMVVQSAEDRAATQSPEESREVSEELLTSNGSETIQSDAELVEVTADTEEVLIQVVSSERDKVFSTELVLDLCRHPSVLTPLSEENTDQTTSQSLQLSTNGPSIRIELVPPDDLTLEEEERSSENLNHLFLLLGFDHSERQLLQTAQSLVHAAVNAAVDQLTREQQSSSARVHIGPQGCRDHA